MNLRTIKKDIEFFVGEFIEDCDLFVALHPQTDPVAVDNLIDEAVTLHNELKEKVSHPEGPKKAWYDSIIKELFERLDGLCEKLSEAASAKQEEAPKAPKAKAPKKAKAEKAEE